MDRLLFVLLTAAILVTLVSLRTEMRASGYTTIDATRSRLDPPWGWVDPRWHDQLSHRLAALGPIDSEDPVAIERLRLELDELSFVSAVGEAVALMPDGLRVPVRFADVVACARVGRWFQPVSSDGRLLPGRWPSPPAAGAGYLPVIGPVEAAPPDLRAGQRLPGSVARGGVAVATSMWRHLDDAAIARLGRVVIDATRAVDTSVEEPGTRLLLEGGREVLFGRTPDLDEPGELPVSSKWNSLSRALEALDSDDRATRFNWAVCDLRWDQAELSAHPDAQLEALPGEQPDPDSPPDAEPATVDERRSPRQRSRIR